MRILVLGATGMMGSAVLRLLSETPDFIVYGSVRVPLSANLLPQQFHSMLLKDIDVGNSDSLVRVFESVRPNIVINCVGLIKQNSLAKNVLSTIPINTLLPHRLAQLCAMSSARLIHLSTDCVFSGSKGMYTEDDTPDAIDLYGLSKLLGEVDYPHAITLRTSVIGHELEGTRSLISWFLSQQGSVTGYTKAIFSGLPSVEIARLIRDHVIPRKDLHGLYHVSSEPINKFELLNLVAKSYGKKIVIHPDSQLVIDRSLDSTRFRTATGFIPKSWPDLVQSMRDFH